jgi:hypothetical protein
MAVSIDSDGRAIDTGTPRALFAVRLAGTIFNSATAFGTNANAPYPYVVSRDGQRFLVSEDASRVSGETPLTVVLNWTTGLKWREFRK